MLHSAYSTVVVSPRLPSALTQTVQPPSMVHESIYSMVGYASRDEVGGMNM